MWYNISMNTTERMDYAAERKRSMNCCQAVLVSFAEELGQTEDFLMKLGSGFGSGMAMMEGTCGALVGAIMVSSLLADEGQARRLSMAILPKFKKLCGATACHALKGVKTGNPLCSCENCVRNAVWAASEALGME